MFKNIKQDFDKVKEIPRSNSFDYNKLKSVINNKEWLVESSHHSESSCLLSTPDSIKFKLDSDDSLDKIRDKIKANEVLLDDLKFDLKSDSEKDELKNDEWIDSKWFDQINIYRWKRSNENNGANWTIFRK